MGNVDSVEKNYCEYNLDCGVALLRVPQRVFHHPDLAGPVSSNCQRKLQTQWMRSANGLQITEKLCREAEFCIFIDEKVTFYLPTQRELSIPVNEESASF